ncbi:hypothetical protein PVAND_012728 [Polypedilum vanderplanki]|uniref:Uncharacterized protein n=1 Tax=Polypedilum vanderplanki TaxID=319348 RepID=A0A9J6CMI0_POLVA|nr:hypothetical protein PVAND_012728 [Polypedilum vanderplanki]
MKISFFIVDREQKIFKCYLLGERHKDNYRIKAERNEICGTNESRFLVSINCYQFYIFLNEIDNCSNFKFNLARKIKSLPNSYFVVQLIPSKYEYIDVTWGEIVNRLCYEQIEIEYMLSWLSTLGGGFSSLGDYFVQRAEIAGKIAIYQMKIAIRIGDPNLLSRCKLYFSISLIQQNKFKFAQRIIRDEYEFSKTVVDGRLRKMCLGIWSKLQYSHKMYKESKRNLRRQKL